MPSPTDDGRRPASHPRHHDDREHRFEHDLDGSTLGMVLSGGGARGAFQVGAYERLIQEPRFRNGPRVLSGTSAGSINAALIAAGKTPREMLDFWHGIADDPPVIASDRFFHDATMSL